MEKLLSNELTKYIIILGAGGLALSAVTAKLIAKLRGSFKPYQKSTVLYIIAFLFFFAVICIAALPMFYHSSSTSLVIFQAYFLLLGSFHIFFLSNSLEWSQEEGTFVPEMLFTLLISFFGALTFLLVFRWLNKSGMEFFMTATVVMFIIPFFFYHTFKRAISIPPKIWKQWFYPVSSEIEEPEDGKMKNLVVISFEFQKNSKESQLTNFRAKAPRDMEFGELFYFFINDYNEMHSNGKIQFANGDGKAQGWIFYKKPKWYSIATRYVDTEKTIFANKIYENDVIVCTRSQI